MSETHDPPDLGEPVAAPELARRVRLYRGQWIGIPLLMLIPLLAVFNVFGEKRAQARIASGEMELHVDYPTRARTGARTELRFELRNLAGRVLDTVDVAVDSAYLSAFTAIHPTPPARRAYVVELHALEPGETRLVRIELEGERPWRSEGWVAATSRRADTVRHRLSTFLFP